MAVLNVSAVLVTRGDVGLGDIIDSLTVSGIEDIVVWDNSLTSKDVTRQEVIPGAIRVGQLDEPLAVYGRYAAIHYAKHDLIYVQDDDVIVSDPQAIVQAWLDRVEHDRETRIVEPEWMVVANMPQTFRHDFYSDHCLVGFGAVFHRNAFDRAMRRFANGSLDAAATLAGSHGNEELMWWRRTCDIVFTALTPRVLVDVPYRNLPWAEDETRMYRSENHVAERARMLDLVRQVRDA